MHHQKSDSSSFLNFPAARLLRGGLALSALFALGAKLAAGTLFLSNLSGANELTPTVPTANGLGVIIVNDAGTSSTITTSWKGVTGITGGRIHRGAANVNGPAIFPFAAVGNPSAPFTWNLSATALNDMRNGGLYLDLTTAAFPDGVIRGQIFHATLSPAATTVVQNKLANLVLDVSAGFDADLDQLLIQTNLAPLATQTQTLDELLARTAYAPARAQIESMTDLTDSLFAQADDARQGAAAPGRLGTFFRGGEGFGHRAATENRAASTISRPFAAAGVEYGFTGHNRVGLALGYADGRDKFENGAGRANTRTTAAHAFFSAELAGTGIALDGAVGYGWSQVTTTRNLSTFDRVADARFDGTTWSAALKASYAVKFEQATLIPYALVNTQEARLDAYTETGAGAVNLVIPRITSRNSAIEGGATLLLPIKVSSGSLTARVQAGWQYLFEDGADVFSTRLAGSPVAFDTQLDGLGRSALHLEAALTATLVNGTRLNLGYRGQLGADGQTTNALEARVVFSF